MVQQMAIYEHIIVSVPLLCPTQRINLSRQDEGSEAFHFLQQASDMSPQQLNQKSLIISAAHVGLNIGTAIAQAV